MLPLIAVVIVLAGLSMAAVARFGGITIDRARASAAADAAALAGAAEGRGAADALARANRAEMQRYEELGDDTRVRVRVGRVTATARAHGTGGSGDAGLPPSRKGVAPAMAAALARADQVLGTAVSVTAVHPPGLAVDVTPDDAARLAGLSAETGLCSAGGERFAICSSR